MIRVAVALAVAAALAGCGEKRHGGSAATGSSRPAATISESEFKLSPAAASVAPGASVVVKNAGSTTHALLIKLPNGHIRTRDLAPGQSVTVQAPDKAGTYKMWCPIDGHRRNGMSGALKVGESSSGSSGSSTPAPAPGGY